MNRIPWNPKKPKICVPIMEKSAQEVLEQAKQMSSMNIDLVEWRIDVFDQIEDLSKCIELALAVKEQLGQMDLLITCRTQKEGGFFEGNKTFYKELYRTICTKQAADLIDLEFDRGKDVFEMLLPIAGQHQIQVIASHHNFEKTPSKEKILHKLMVMKESKADILKMACMPQNKQDVFNLMEATASFKERFPDTVLITMAMAKEGMPSRILGEFFGSAITFASAGKPSAPGQIDVDTMRVLIDTIHRL